jgi:hypothetical protein
MGSEKWNLGLRGQPGDADQPLNGIGDIMLKVAKAKILSAAFVIAWSCSALAAQPSPVAPVPSQIMAAKKVFISNAGINAPALFYFKQAGDPQQHYDLFYAAMKNWGQYELVSAPADADLVLEIRFTAEFSHCDESAGCNLLTLDILDAKTHFTLWTLSELVASAVLKGNWNKNMNAGTASLVDDLKQLASGAALTIRAPKN